MPHIHPELREVLRQTGTPTTVGELNYVVTTIVRSWLAQEPPSYERLNAAVGVLECAKLEMYRLVVSPYEDEKIAENGSAW